jgi:hypothetical protein
MADRYGILPAATSSNTSSTGTWSETNGGATGASVPISTDSVKSGNLCVAGAAAVMVVDVALFCLNMDWTGATNTPRLSLVGNDLGIYDDLTFIAAMSVTGSFTWIKLTGTGTAEITTNGIDLDTGQNIYLRFEHSGGKVLLKDNLLAWTIVYLAGDLDTNSKTITASRVFDADPTNTGTLTLGSSTINITNGSGANEGWLQRGTITILANTATINVSGTGTGAFGNANYNGATFNFNGTAHTLSGSPTGIAGLNFKPSGVQTITATGTTLTFASMVRTGVGTLTIVNGTFVKTGGRVHIRNASISGSTAQGGASFYAGASVDNGGNSGWIFKDPPRGGAWK